MSVSCLMFSVGEIELQVAQSDEEQVYAMKQLFSLKKSYY